LKQRGNVPLLIVACEIPSFFVDDIADDLAKLLLPIQVVATVDVAEIMGVIELDARHR